MKELKEIKKLLRFLFERDDLQKIKEASESWELFTKTITKLCEENNTKLIGKLEDSKIIKEKNNRLVLIDVTKIRGWKWKDIIKGIALSDQYDSAGSYNLKSKIINLKFNPFKEPILLLSKSSNIKDTYTHEFTHAYDITGSAIKKSKKDKGRIIKKYVDDIIKNIKIKNPDDYEEYKNNPLEYNAFLRSFLEKIYKVMKSSYGQKKFHNLSFQEFYNFVTTSSLFQNSYKMATDKLNEKYKKKFMMRLFSFWNELKNDV